MNSTMVQNASWLEDGKPNSTAKGAQEIYSDEVSITMIFMCCLVLLIGVTGNALVCWCLGKRNVRKTTDIFLLALALADLLASLTGSCDIIISFSSKYTGWKLEDTSDKMVQCIVLTTLAVSAWTLTAIAFDRFWAITRPFESYKITAKIRLIVSLLIWLTSTASTAIYMFSEDVGLKGDPFLICIVIMVFFAWFLPVLLMTTLYTICIKKLRSESMRIPRDILDQRTRENKRVVKMFVIVTTTFFASAFPSVLISFIFVSTDEGGVVYLIREIAFVIMLIGCVVNPFIYAKMHKEINPAFVTMWRKIKRMRTKSAREERTVSGISNFCEMAERDTVSSVL